MLGRVALGARGAWELGRERLDTHPLSKIPGYATVAVTVLFLIRLSKIELDEF